MNTNLLFDYLLTIIICIGSILFGYELFQNSIIYFPKYGYLNFGEYHYILGLLFLIFGLAMTIAFILGIMKKNDN